MCPDNEIANDTTKWLPSNCDLNGNVNVTTCSANCDPILNSETYFCVYESAKLLDTVCLPVNYEAIAALSAGSNSYASTIKSYANTETLSEW